MYPSVPHIVGALVLRNRLQLQQSSGYFVFKKERRTQDGHFERCEHLQSTKLGGICEYCPFLAVER